MNSNLTRLLDAAKAAKEENPGEWEWDGKPWDYDPSEEAPWLLDKVGFGGNPVISGEVKTTEAIATYLAEWSPETAVKLIEVITLQRKSTDAFLLGCTALGRSFEEQADAILETLGNGEAR